MTERYSTFYSEYKNRLFSYLLYKSGDYEVARDIMQESFTRHLQHYGNDAAISPALLFTIARNALVDHHRYRERFQLSENVVPQTEAFDERSVLGKEQSARINKALDALPKKDRELLALAVGGVPYKEIGLVFEISEANVKVRVHRIRTRLRQMLKNEVE